MTKPSLNSKSRYKQGIYIPKNPSKYIGRDGESISYRSNWERRVMIWFDMNPGVVAWNSESCIVPYHSLIDNKMHKYYVDFLAKMRRKDGSEKTYAIEVKPYAQTVPPTTRNKNRLILETHTYITNQAKWEAAKNFFGQQNVSFLVLTEFDLGIK
jgi:hypothetical protein